MPCLLPFKGGPLCGRITRAQALLVLAVCLFYSWASVYFSYHNDIGWHLAAGDYIRAHAAVPMTDPWAYTSGGAPWINMAWSWDILASVIYQFFGMSGLVALTAIAGLLTMMLLAAASLRFGASPIHTAVIAMLAAIAFPFYAPPSTFLSAAPQQMSLVLTAALIWLLSRAELKRTAALLPLLPVALLFVVWVNVHGGFILGLALLALVVVTAALRRDRALCRQMLLWLLAAMLACLVNPYGLGVMEGVRGTLGHPYQSQVHEWQPLWHHLHPVTGVPAMVYIGLLLVGLTRIRMLWQHSASMAALLLLLALLAVQSWLVLRAFSMVILVSVPVAAWGLSQIFPLATRPWAAWLLKTTSAPGVVAAALALLVGSIAARGEQAYSLVDILNPQAQIANILQHYPHQRLLNHWNYGSFIIHESRGELKPFIDGRLGTAYPPSVFADYARFTQQPEQRLKLLEEYGIELILWPLQDSEMLRFLQHNGWQIVHQGTLAALLHQPLTHTPQP